MHWRSIFPTKKEDISFQCQHRKQTPVHITYGTKGEVFSQNHEIGLGPVGRSHSVQDQVITERHTKKPEEEKEIGDVTLEFLFQSGKPGGARVDGDYLEQAQEAGGADGEISHHPDQVEKYLTFEVIFKIQ